MSLFGSRSQSITTKYLFWLIPTFAVSLFIFGLYIYYTARENDLAYNAAMGRIITQQTNQALIRWIEEQRDIARTIANDPRIIKVCQNPTDIDSRAAAQEFLNFLHKLHPHYENIPLAIKLPPEKEIPLNVNGKSLSIRNGNFFMDTVEGKTIGKCDANISYIKQTFYENKPYYVSEVYPSLLRGNPIVVVASPIIQGSEILGSVIVAPRMDYFTKFFLEDSRIGETGYLSMIDDRGLMISHPDTSLILNEATKDKVKDLFAKIKEGKVAFLEKFDGKLKSYVIAKFTSKDFHIRNDWYIVCATDYDEIVKDANQTLLKVVACIAIIALFIGFMIYFLTRSVIKLPLMLLTDATNRVATGDLTETLELEATCNLDKGNEIGLMFHAVKSMTRNLRAQTTQIRLAVLMLNSLAAEIAQTAVQQEAVAMEHKNASVQVTSAVKEISATSSELSKTMQGIEGGFSETQTVADNGRASLTNMEKTMHQLGAATQLIKEKLAVIDEKSTLIGSVVTTITNVANQINLLSLNASIEAEKAGEYGRGFSVIARETRRLADQTAIATLEIEEMVREMRLSVSHGVSEMDKFAEEVIKGIMSVGSVSGQLSQIIARVQKLAPQFTMVNDGMSTQALGAQNISEAMVQWSEGAAKTSNSLGKLKSASEKLREAAKNLQLEISQFKL